MNEFAVSLYSVEGTNTVPFSLWIQGSLTEDVLAFELQDVDPAEWLRGISNIFLRQASFSHLTTCTFDVNDIDIFALCDLLRANPQLASFAAHISHSPHEEEDATDPDVCAQALLQAVNELCVTLTPGFTGKFNAILSTACPTLHTLRLQSNITGPLSVRGCAAPIFAAQLVRVLAIRELRGLRLHEVVMQPTLTGSERSEDEEQLRVSMIEPFLSLDSYVDQLKVLGYDCPREALFRKRDVGRMWDTLLEDEQAYWRLDYIWEHAPKDWPISG